MSYWLDYFCSLSKREQNQLAVAEAYTLRGPSQFVTRVLAPHVFEAEKHYFGLSDRMNVAGRNDIEARVMATLLAQGGAASWHDYSLFTNPLRPCDKDDPDYHSPSNRVVIGPYYTFTYEFDNKSAEFFRQQLAWFRGHERDTKIGELYHHLAQFADFRGITVVYSGNKSFHVHCVFDPNDMAAQFELTNNAHDIRHGFIAHWYTVKADVMRVLEPKIDGEIVEPDASLRFPEWYRRLPGGSRVVELGRDGKPKHAFGIPVGTTVPQLVMWERFKTRATAGADALFFRPDRFVAVASNEKRRRNTSRSALAARTRADGFSADDLDYIEAKLREAFPGWPRFLSLTHEAGSWVARFQNSESDMNPSSIMKEGFATILLAGAGAEHLPPPQPLPFPLLTMMRLWRDELRRKLQADEAEDTEVVFDFETALRADDTAAHPLEIEFQQAATDRASARKAAQEFFRRIVKRRPFVWAKGPEGGGKSTSLMIQHDKFVAWLRKKRKPTLSLYAFTDYHNAAEKCDEFNALHWDTGVFGVVIKSFSRLYAEACEELKIAPISQIDAARQGFTAVWHAVEFLQPKVFDYFRDRHREAWTAVGHRTPVFFTVHDVAHMWRGAPPSRLMWAKDFWERGGDPFHDKDHRGKTELGLLVHDEVSVANLLEMQRAEVVEWLGRLVDTDPENWASRKRTKLVNMYLGYTHFVAANGHPVIDGEVVEVTFDEARRLARLGDFDEWEDVIVTDTGAYKTNGPFPIYTNCVGNRWKVIRRQWWRGDRPSDPNFWTAHRVVILTTEALPTALIPHCDYLAFKRRFSLETPQLARDTVTALLRKGVTSDRVAATCKDVRDELEALHPGRTINIVGNKVSSLSDTQSHVSARGSNQYKGEVVLQTMAYMAPEEHEHMLVLNEFMDRDDAVILRHIDVFNQTCGRNLGFRATADARHYLLANPNLFLNILAEGGMAYSRYDVAVQVDAKKRARLRAKQAA